MGLDHDISHLPNAKLWGTDTIIILTTAAVHEAKVKASIFFKKSKIFIFFVLEVLN